MDGGAAVTDLVDNINRAFSQQNIAQSVARLAGISRRADFLTISRALDILPPMDNQVFRRYRQNITIPRVIQQILTNIHHYALFRQPPTPMRIEINDVTPPSIEVTHTENMISIILNRPHPGRNRSN